MATEKKTTFNKEDVRRAFGDEVADKIGTYKEATGGGTPLAKGEKLKDHPEAKRVMQPRDEDGQFTYNAVNEKPLKYGPSRGKTPMPIFDSVRSKFKKKGNTEYSTNEEDGLKRVKLNMSFEEFEKQFKEFHTEEGWTGLNVEISSKRGRRTKKEKEAVENKNYGPIFEEFEKEKGKAKPKKPKFGKKTKPEPTKPVDEQPKEPGQEETQQSPEQSKSETVDAELAKNDKQAFVEKYSQQIDDLMEYADSKGQEVVLDDIVEAFATGENTSFEEMKKEIDKAAGVDTTEGEKVDPDYQPGQEKTEKPVIEEQKEKNDIQPTQEPEQIKEETPQPEQSVTSEQQKTVKPEWQVKEIQKLAEKYGSTPEEVEAFLDKEFPDKIPFGSFLEQFMDDKFKKQESEQEEPQQQEISKQPQPEKSKQVSTSPQQKKEKPTVKSIAAETGFSEEETRKVFQDLKGKYGRVNAEMLKRRLEDIKIEREKEAQENASLSDEEQQAIKNDREAYKEKYANELKQISFDTGMKTHEILDAILNRQKLSFGIKANSIQDMLEYAKKYKEEKKKAEKAYGMNFR